MPNMLKCAITVIGLLTVQMVAFAGILLIAVQITTPHYAGCKYGQHDGDVYIAANGDTIRCDDGVLDDLTTMYAKR